MMSRFVSVLMVAGLLAALGCRRRQSRRFSRRGNHPHRVVQRARVFAGQAVVCRGSSEHAQSSRKSFCFPRSVPYNNVLVERQ